jgi:hypothetical protein
MFMMMWKIVSKEVQCLTTYKKKDVIKIYDYVRRMSNKRETYKVIYKCYKEEEKICLN